MLWYWLEIMLSLPPIAFARLKDTASTILKRKGVMMRITLTMNDVARFSVGPAYATGPIYRYEVRGLPPKIRVFINNAGCPNRDDWRIQWVENGVDSDGSVGYPNAAEALAAIQKDFC